jgi:hypothetical protein
VYASDPISDHTTHDAKIKEIQKIQLKKPNDVVIPKTTVDPVKIRSKMKTIKKKSKKSTKQVNYLSNNDDNYFVDTAAAYMATVPSFPASIPVHNGKLSVAQTIVTNQLYDNCQSTSSLYNYHKRISEDFYLSSYSNHHHHHHHPNYYTNTANYALQNFNQSIKNNFFIDDGANGTNQHILTV